MTAMVWYKDDDVDNAEPFVTLLDANDTFIVAAAFSRDTHGANDKLHFMISTPDGIRSRMDPTASGIRPTWTHHAFVYTRYKLLAWLISYYWVDRNYLPAVLRTRISRE